MIQKQRLDVAKTNWAAVAQPSSYMTRLDQTKNQARSFGWELDWAP